MTATTTPAVVRAALAARLVGCELQIEQVISCLVAGLPVLLAAPPGSGKTTLATATAQALGLEPGWVQGAPDVLPGDLTGFVTPNLVGGEPRFDPGPLASELVVVDELPQLPPRSLAPLREAITLRRITPAGQPSRPLPASWWLAATAVDDELERRPLDPSLADRFAVVHMPVLSVEAMAAVLSTPPGPVEPVASSDDLTTWRAQAAAVEVHADLIRWTAELAVAAGCSIRLAQDLLALSRSHALQAAQDFVAPDNLAAVLHCVLDHRAGERAGAALTAHPLPGRPKRRLR